jgi:hypothetical protein
MGMRQRSMKRTAPQRGHPPTIIESENIMNAKRIIIATVAAIALSPLAAFADAGDEESKQWLDSLQSTRTVEEVRAEARNLPSLGQLHPVELQTNTPSTVTRAEVRAELARHGVSHFGA